MIAVTGATGLLGNAIIRKLVDAGENFIAIKRKGSDTSLLTDIASKISWREADVTDTVALDEALQGVTCVIHSAGLVSFNSRDKKRLYDVNVMGTRNLINASLRRNIRRFVHVSSVAALSRPKDVIQIDEEQKWIESPLNTTYAESKYLSELEVMRGHEEGLNTVIVNPSVILGPGDWNRSSAKFFRYIWNGNSLYTDGSMNYVDANDVASIIIALINTPFNGERFIVNAGSIPYKLLFEKIAENFNKHPPSIKAEKKVLSFFAGVERLRSFITGSEPLVTKETAQLANTTIVYSNEKVKNKLNFIFQSIDDTLKQCCEYYILQGNGKK
ncbi:MAG TPA: NAD-dependent epimerase/dehydratase family protein [Cyclobacteriaceae bacterium]|nr:NAD-dependent epimerase/dehydratase family protein [Cyclobacteriaceae bacterium]